MYHLEDQVLFYSVLPSPLVFPSNVKRKKEPPPPKASRPHNPPTPKPQPAPQISPPPPPPPSESSISFSSLPSFKVDIKSWEQDLRYLASLNRCAKSNTSDVRRAGEWLAQKLRELPNIEVETDNVTVKEVYESCNVIGTLKGTVHPDIWYVIGAHYDSTSENTKVAAPGALDNASGSAAVLEMARIFSTATFPFTIIFALFTGEEQGFFGSKKLVQNMFIKDEIYQVKLMLNMDMIALDQDIIIETREASLAEIWEPLANSNSLVPTVSYDIWGSDHVTFANAGVPSILTCSDHSKYPHYHRTTDVPDNLDVRAGYNTITMNVQAIYRRMQADSEFFAVD